MTGKGDFSDDDWAKILEAPAKAGVGVSLLAPGVVAFFKELAAATQAIADAKEAFSSNALVKAVIEDFESRQREEPEQVAGPKETPESILDQLAAVAAIVEARATAEEARGFGEFLVGLAEQVAEACGSGFLGLGEKVSPAEREYIARLRRVLRL